jgi:hypothetical protein
VSEKAGQQERQAGLAGLRALIATLRKMLAWNVAWLSRAEHFCVVRRMLGSGEPSYDQGPVFVQIPRNSGPRMTRISANGRNSSVFEIRDHSRYSRAVQFPAPTSNPIKIQGVWNTPQQALTQDPPRSRMRWGFLVDLETDIITDRRLGLIHHRYPFSRPTIMKKTQSASKKTNAWEAADEIPFWPVCSNEVTDTQVRLSKIWK